jgi:hypothetical protein
MTNSKDEHDISSSDDDFEDAEDFPSTLANNGNNSSSTLHTYDQPGRPTSEAARSLNDQSLNQQYDYYNQQQVQTHQTNNSQQHDAPLSVTDPEPEWELLYTEEGYEYYQHYLTGESCWSLPDNAKYYTKESTEPSSWSYPQQEQQQQEQEWGESEFKSYESATTTFTTTEQQPSAPSSSFYPLKQSLPPTNLLQQYKPSKSQSQTNLRQPVNMSKSSSRTLAQQLTQQLAQQEQQVAKTATVSSPQHSQQSTTRWEVLTNPEGVTYYYDTTTETSTWARPKELDLPIPEETRVAKEEEEEGSMRSDFTEQVVSRLQEEKNLAEQRVAELKTRVQIKDAQIEALFDPKKMRGGSSKFLDQAEQWRQRTAHLLKSQEMFSELLATRSREAERYKQSSEQLQRDLMSLVNEMNEAEEASEQQQQRTGGVVSPHKMKVDMSVHVQAAKEQAKREFQ